MENAQGVNELPPLFAAPPSVYAVGGAYCVFVPVSGECTMSVSCGGRTFYDHANGILRSGRPVHSAEVPRALLEKERSYSVSLRPILERRPYFTKTGPVQTLSVGKFRPCDPRGGTLRVLEVADTHSLVDAPVAAASALKRNPDLLALCGDIPEDCGSNDRMAVPHVIAGRITGGAFPCVFARGNHDLRGVCAERFAELTPSDGGRSYFEFRSGPVWGLVLDTGEDKADSHPEYGCTVCCEEFREEQERWLRRIARRGAPRDARFRILVCHTPFAFRLPPPFDIEGARWRRWCRMLAPMRFQAMLTGHLHDCWLEAPGGPHDTYGAPCPVVCASRIDRERKWHVAGDIAVGPDGTVAARYIDSLGACVGRGRVRPARAP